MSRRSEERVRVGSVDLAALAHRAGDGPVVVVTANMHGDEATGVAAVHELDRLLARDLRRGTVVLYPSLNPEGLEAGARRFADGDLNRSFPGTSRGGVASRAALAIWTDLIGRAPHAAIDLHADSAASVPYALVDRGVHRSADRGSLERRSEALARATGLLWLREYPDDDYLRYRLDASLAGALLNHGGVPSVTVEVGPRRLAQPASVAAMVRAVLGILGSLGLIDAPAPPEVSGGPWRRASTARAEQAGMFVPLLEAGAAFDTGDVLGEVRAVDGAVRWSLRAPGRGRVVAWAEGAWLAVGATAGTLALEERPA